MTDTPLNPDALRKKIEAFCENMAETGQMDRMEAIDLLHEAQIHLAVAQPEVNSVEAFINQRPGYITALKNTRGTDDQSDYWRWQGHAESRRQLAQSLGWTVPHNPGETTSPEVKP